jgi:hypothetical protein
MERCSVFPSSSLKTDKHQQLRGELTDADAYQQVKNTAHGGSLHSHDDGLMRNQGFGRLHQISGHREEGGGGGVHAGCNISISCS